jgi:8-oxo-dGTP diphosphatase
MTSFYNIEIEEFFKTAFSVDCVVFGFSGKELQVLLIERGQEPFEGMAALPGDLVYPNEDLDSAANRVLKDLTGLDDVFLQQVEAFGQVGRHPLGRVVTVSYFSLIKPESKFLHASSWAESAQWVNFHDIPELAFDHSTILNSAYRRLQDHVRHKPIGFELLPKKFTLSELQALYEVILGKQFDKANFRKKILGMNLLVGLNEQERKVSHRPARLYSFYEEHYNQLCSEGFSFEL